MTHFAREYGNALYELAAEEKLCDEIMQQLSMLEECFAADPDYIRLLCTRSIEMDERTGLIDEAFSGSLHPYLLNYIKMLTERGAMDYFGECARRYRRLYNEANNIAEASVRSAAALTDEQRTALIARLEEMTGMRIVLSSSVDPALIGGMQVDLLGRRYDNSIRTRLASLRRNLTESE